MPKFPIFYFNVDDMSKLMNCILKNILLIIKLKKNMQKLREFNIFTSAEHLRKRVQ